MAGITAKFEIGKTAKIAERIEVITANMMNNVFIVYCFRPEADLIFSSPLPTGILNFP